MLTRKLGRELWRQRKLTLTVGIVMMLGVALFEGSAVSYLNLLGSYGDTQKRLALADWHLEVDRITPDEVARVRELPGVAAAEGRMVTSLPLVVPNGRIAAGTRGRVVVEGRLVSLRLGRAPELDRLLLRQGTLPTRGDQIVVEEHFAAHHDLAPGSELQVQLAGMTRTLVVSGIAVSPEYLWVTRSRHDVMPSFTEFGVVWIDRATLQGLVRSGMQALIANWQARMASLDPKLLEALRGSSQVKGLLLAAQPDVGNQLLVQTGPHEDRVRVRDAVIAALGEGRVHGATARHDLPSIELLQMDLDAMRGIAQFFPLLFLGVGAFVVASLLTRLVDAQRPLIGTMLALGVPRRRVLAHYMAYALIIGTVGSALGALLGYFLGGIVTHRYAAELTIPFVTIRPHWDVIGAGLALGVVTSALAGLGPARRAAAVLPADAMRPPSPAMTRAAYLLRNLGGSLPVPLRLVLRNLVRRPLRSLASAGGVAAALVLVLTAWGTMDCLNRAIEVQFDESHRYHLRVDLLVFEPSATLEDRVRAVGGVDAVETGFTLPIRLSTPSAHYETLLQGLPAGGTLLRTVQFSGQSVAPRAGGLVLSRGIATKLGVGVGDELQLQPVLGGDAPRITARVDALADAAMGGTAFMRLDDAQRVFRREGLVNTALLTTRGPRWEVRGRLQEIPGIARLTDAVDLRERMDALIDVTYLLLWVLLLFSVVLGVSILFNTTTQNILERQRELATMRALGLPMAKVSTMMTIEHAFIGGLGLLLGIPLSLLTLRYTVSLYDNDLFSMPLVIAPATAAISMLGVVLVLLAAQWPSLRQVARLDLADCVREREG